MSTPQTVIMPTLLRSDITANPFADDLSANGSGCSGGWIWAYVSRIGQRHRAAGGVCEDAAGVRVGEKAFVGNINLALADGVSGGARGDIAATALVRHCLGWQRGQNGSLASWVGEGAETAVRRALEANTPAPGAATLAAAWLNPNGSGILTRIGDCRAYAWSPTVARGNMTVLQLLPDQTMAYMGYAPPLSPKASQPAHMVGNQSTGTPEFLPVNVAPGSGLLFSSDGIHDVIGSDELAARLKALVTHGVLIGDPLRFEQVCSELVERAQQLGSEDDVSVLLAARP